jgi:phosphopantothenoylcysteine synthetase/decarboxylase
MKVLITAGPTREAIDPVRFLTNRSSGKMGYTLAGAFVHEGHSVLLISGPTQLDVPQNCDFIPVESAAANTATSIFPR